MDVVARLDEAMAGLSALQARVLAAVGEVTTGEEWVDDGASSPGAWLVARYGVSHQTAASWVQVAQQLGELPVIGEAFAGGRLSFDQVRALCRFATGDDDTEWAVAAEFWSVEQLRREARRRARIDPAEVGEDYRNRYLRWWWGEDERRLHLRGELPAADGVVLVKALNRIAYHAPEHAESGYPEPFAARAADALVGLASQSLGNDPDTDRACVVVHVDAQRLGEEQGAGVAEDGPAVAVASVRRMGCDGRREVVFDDGNGLPIGIGRAARVVPGWLGRQLRHRDGGCRFPGCERTRWVQAHHLVHWVDGGPTDLDNLITLCWHHHHLVHEHHWRITGDPNGEITWVRPDGKPHQPKPPRLHPSIQKRLMDYAAQHSGFPLRGTALNDTS